MLFGLLLCRGQFEYDLVLSSDLNTARHTQWYYFRVQNAVPGVTYTLRIVNLLKKDSLYNYGKLYIIQIPLHTYQHKRGV